MPTGADFFDELRWRSLLHQCTDEQGLARHLDQPRRIYAGFDPTADSLTIGNLVPIMLLRCAQEHGHTPVVVMGGGTGLIGDPSGKEAERPLLSEADVHANVAAQTRIFERLLRFEGDNAAIMCNNLDWLAPLTYIDVLRGVGKHFSVNEMIRRDSVARRLEAREQGISYTEFSYMILQAYDFLHLYEHDKVTVQVGGSDQWGNIASGVDLIRRMMHQRHSGSKAGFTLPGYLYTQETKGHIIFTKEVYIGGPFGLTAPLVTKADGGKFGKTESGAIWLSPERTSAYAFHQFWINTTDADVERFLKMFTLLSRDEITSLMREHAAQSEARVAQRALASAATQLVLGSEASARAEHIAEALFSGDVRSLDQAALDEAFAEAPASEHAAADLAGAGVALVDLLPQTSLARSKREAREFLAAGAISVNGERVEADRRLTPADLLHSQAILLRRGKKHWHATRWR